MKRIASRLGIMATALFWMGWVALSGTSSATMDMQKKAKEAGFKVENCQYCHVDKLPKKDAHGLNDRGNWLVAEKDKRKAKEVDVTWLKDYPGDKK
jgi:hypothetical protein